MSFTQQGMPTHQQLMVPILQAVIDLGGPAKSDEIVDHVTDHSEEYFQTPIWRKSCWHDRRRSPRSYSREKHLTEIETGWHTKPYADVGQPGDLVNTVQSLPASINHQGLRCS